MLYKTLKRIKPLARLAQEIYTLLFIIHVSYQIVLACSCTVTISIGFGESRNLRFFVVKEKSLLIPHCFNVALFGFRTENHSNTVEHLVHLSFSFILIGRVGKSLITSRDFCSRAGAVQTIVRGLVSVRQSNDRRRIHRCPCTST